MTDAERRRRRPPNKHKSSDEKAVAAADQRQQPRSVEKESRSLVDLEVEMACRVRISSLNH